MGVSGGHDDDGDFAELGIVLHGSEHLVAIHLGHHEVEEHQVEVVVGVPHLLEGHLAILRLHRVELARGHEVKQGQSLK